MTAVRSLLQRARRARAERDAGVTLAELTVTMLIGGVLLALVATVVVQSYRLQGKTTYRENDTTDAQIAVDTMSRALRMAVDMQSPTNQVVPAFSTTSPTEVTFTTNLDDDPSKVTFRLDGRILTQTTFRPTTAGRGKASTYPVSGAARQLSRNVVVLPGQLPLFTYFYQDGDSCPTTLPVTVPTEEPMSKVCAVQVTLTVDSDGADGQLMGTTLDALVVNQNLNKK